MAFGLQCQNQAGFTQIDESYSNYVLLQEGVITGTSGVVYFPYQSKPVLIALSLSAMYGQQNFGIDSITSSSFSLRRYGSAPVPYRVYASAEGMPPSSVTHGVRVYTPGGYLAFDSGYRYTRISEVIQVQYGTSMTRYWHSSAPPVKVVYHSASLDSWLIMNFTMGWGGFEEVDEGYIYWYPTRLCLYVENGVLLIASEGIYGGVADPIVGFPTPILHLVFCR